MKRYIIQSLRRIKQIYKNNRVLIALFLIIAFQLSFYTVLSSKDQLYTMTSEYFFADYLKIHYSDAVSALKNYPLNQPYDTIAGYMKPMKVVSPPSLNRLLVIISGVSIPILQKIPIGALLVSMMIVCIGCVFRFKPIIISLAIILWTVNPITIEIYRANDSSAFAMFLILFLVFLLYKYTLSNKPLKWATITVAFLSYVFITGGSTIYYTAFLLLSYVVVITAYSWFYRTKKMLLRVAPFLVISICLPILFLTISTWANKLVFGSEGSLIFRSILSGKIIGQAVSYLVNRLNPVPNSFIYAQSHSYYISFITSSLIILIPTLFFIFYVIKNHRSNLQYVFLLIFPLWGFFMFVFLMPMQIDVLRVFYFIVPTFSFLTSLYLIETNKKIVIPLMLIALLICYPSINFSPTCTLHHTSKTDVAMLDWLNNSTLQSEGILSDLKFAGMFALYTGRITDSRSVYAMSTPESSKKWERESKYFLYYPNNRIINKYMTNSNSRYLVVTDDIIHKTYKGLNVYLKPLGDKYENELGSLASLDKIYATDDNYIFQLSR